jgi:hypothetical protein
MGIVHGRGAVASWAVAVAAVTWCKRVSGPRKDMSSPSIASGREADIPGE